ncbi:hypothetical protein Pcinc_029135 [Petrolisthes cinctipes]|uniref:Uncharacterized protein n=1 Tax=Petrolisthes cinctipes TaxID=88211 RepID=A0AAE1F1H7_PETCI|nr:hypothetical protein Pcinc_029135 [Petrolisthes cinctipes]
MVALLEKEAIEGIAGILESEEPILGGDPQPSTSGTIRRRDVTEELRPQPSTSGTIRRRDVTEELRPQPSTSGTIRRRDVTEELRPQPSTSGTIRRRDVTEELRPQPSTSGTIRRRDVPEESRPQPSTSGTIRRRDVSEELRPQPSTSDSVGLQGQDPDEEDWLDQPTLQSTRSLLSADRMFEIIPPFDAGDFEIPAGVQTLIEHPYCRQDSPPQESRSLGQQRDKSRRSSPLTHSRARSRARSLASSPAVHLM